MLHLRLQRWRMNLFVKGPIMAFVVNSQFRTLFAGLILAIVSLFWVDAQRAQAGEPLSDYVIKQFGKPPAIPKGALEQSVKDAVETAFIQSLERGNWGNEQTLALNDVVASKDPRLVWIIADLLRFATSRNLDAVLGDAASKLLGKELGAANYWGTVTDHLIAWDIPAPPEYLNLSLIHI